jgi:hypothetical protein
MFAILDEDVCLWSNFFHKVLNNIISPEIAG